jgi:2-amino-4-hydroxy-6-hydroxymethyldihydropteridine diphosphokinase
MKIHTVYIGIGSNINPESNIEASIKLMKKHFRTMISSSFYYTKAISNKKDDDYINGVIKATTAINPYILKYLILKKIEKKLGRIKQSDKFSSRTIDLDILLYNGRVINNFLLKIPDKDIFKRNFISFPLYELNPNLIVPDENIPIKRIIKKMDKKNMKLNKKFSIKISNLIERAYAKG